MTAATLWIEITIAGSVYLAALVFLCLRLLGIGRIPVVADDLLPYLAAGVVAASYILGMLMHRLLQLGWSGVIRLRKTRPWLSDSDYFQAHYARDAIVWQFGSERLHRELDFQFALKALFRSLLVSIPFLAVTLSLWLGLTPWRGAVPLVIALAAALTAALVATYRQQSKVMANIRSVARDVAEQAVHPGAQPRPGGGAGQ